MENKYKNLEEFLIEITRKTEITWRLNDKNERDKVELIKVDPNNISKFIRTTVSLQNTNELNIHISDSGKSHQEITININKVPQFISHLSFAESPLQMNAMIFLGREKFYEIKNYLNEFIKKGNINGQPVIKDDNPHVFKAQIDDNDLRIYVPEINTSNLGFQVVSMDVTHKNESNNHTINLVRLIPLHQIDELPFLMSIVKKPQVIKDELIPNIDEFINFFSNLELGYLSKVARTIELNMQLNEELAEDKNNNKRLKL